MVIISYFFLITFSDWQLKLLWMGETLEQLRQTMGNKLWRQQHVFFSLFRPFHFHMTIWAKNCGDNNAFSSLYFVYFTFTFTWQWAINCEDNNTSSSFTFTFQWAMAMDNNLLRQQHVFFPFFHPIHFPFPYPYFPWSTFTFFIPFLNQIVMLHFSIAPPLFLLECSHFPPC